MSRPIVIAGIDLTKHKDILLLTPEHLEPEETDQISNILNSRFKDVNFTVLSGGFTAISFDAEPGMIIGEIDE